MVIGFRIGDKSDASFYCGILIASFSLAESLTSIWWGSLSDRVGRKPVLLFGCFGTILSLLVVGFSNSFAMALFGRILGGLLNGNIGMFGS
jgi:MFS family permease